MKWSLRIGTLFGIRVELHVTFLLLVVGLAVARGFSTGDPRRALETAVLLLAVFACVLLHELGHALAARRYGIRTRDIVLLPIGGIARLERMPEKPSQEIVVALAGPAVNLALALLLIGVVTISHEHFAALGLGGGLVDSLLAVNVFMLLFNLIPAFPMDGGRVLRALLATRLPYARATRVAAGVGQALAVVFAVWGVFNANPMLLFVALFVFMAASEEYALVRTQHALTGLPVISATLSDVRWLAPTDPLEIAVERLIAGSQQEFPVVDGGRAVGMLTRADLLKGLQSGGTDAPVGAAMTPLTETLDPSEPLETALRRMRERGLAAMVVASAGRPIGLLTLENVSELLLVRGALERRSGAA
ncbi:MAG TPA: site-2 protease family protein [Dongiaceae bacterium]|nr:site-2 protease family protein [Dongiaceae bacterium]